MSFISKMSLTDAVLARAALCGDITHRGSMLTDNDVYALSALADTVVPAVLEANAIPFTASDVGWTLGATSFGTHVVANHLVAHLLYTLTGDESLRPVPLSEASAPRARIRPYYI